VVKVVWKYLEGTKANVKKDNLYRNRKGKEEKLLLDLQK
jgi:hypothetical protein